MPLSQPGVTMAMRKFAAASLELVVLGVGLLMAAPYLFILLWPFITGY